MNYKAFKEQIRIPFKFWLGFFYTTNMKTSELKPNEYNPFYHTYISALGEVELLKVMANQLDNFPNFIDGIPVEKMKHAYSEGKWTIAEVLQHIVDAERVFQYRALSFSRNDQTPLPGFDENLYVPQSFASEKSKETLIEEYKAVRASSLSLYKSFSDDVLKRKGTASSSVVSVAALGFIICGHQRHHRNIIRERYL